MHLSTSSLIALVAMAAAGPSVVNAALFPKGSQVKVIDEKGFNAAMEKNETSVVAFVAPWCGHCQKMAPEYSKAALGFYPLIPAYAVNCNLEKNKPLCGRQGVKGFPTVKLFPRGKQMEPVEFTQERTASGFWYFATRGIPNFNNKYSQVFEVMPWIRKNKDKHRLLLLGKEKKVPLLWRVLANKYSHLDISFASIRDRKGRVSKEMGFEVGGEKESKVMLYPKGSEEPFRYEGILKQESLSKFIDSVLDGTADIKKLNEEAASEEFSISEEELEIERKQEAQRIALMHGGYNDIIDFEKAMLNGAGADFHDTHGYGGMMGDIPEHMKKKKAEPTPAAAEGETMAATPTASVVATPVVDDNQVPVKASEKSGGCSACQAESEGSCGCGRVSDEL